MFINRISELKVLESEYRKNSATFTVIYGRRRVGKTALISHYIKNRPHIYFYATGSSINSQLQSFVKEVMKLSNLSYAKNLKFESFEDIFEFLYSLEFDKKIVIAIDEYQNLCRVDKSFSSMLQKSWDMHLSSKNIHLILCGSVLSMMHSEVLSYTAPLYGRRTTNIHLKPINFRYLKEFLPNLNQLELINAYSSFGTIPKYLLMYEQDKSFKQNLLDNILNKDSYLYSEGNFLLKQEIGDVGSYFSILESISKGNTKIGNIASSLEVHSSYLPKYLNKLIELNILIKEIPVTEKNPLKSKFGRYKIVDKFLNFWFFYVYKNYNYLEINQTQSVIDEIELNFNDKFVSFAFEDIILEEILYNPKSYLNFTPKKIGRWWNNKEEIDIVAFDDENISFIECKWQNRVNKEKIRDKLIQKSKVIKHNKKNEEFLVIIKEDYLKSTLF